MIKLRPALSDDHAGASTISRPNVTFTFTSGSTASMCEFHSRVPHSAAGDQGATPEGKRNWSGSSRACARAQSRKEFLLEPQTVWACDGPKLAVADGALELWQADEQVGPKTLRPAPLGTQDRQCCLNKLPESQQSKAKRALQKICMVEIKNNALVAFDTLSRSGFQI